MFSVMTLISRTYSRSKYNKISLYNFKQQFIRFQFTWIGLKLRTNCTRLEMKMNNYTRFSSKKNLSKFTKIDDKSKIRKYGIVQMNEFILFQFIRKRCDVQNKNTFFTLLSFCIVLLYPNRRRAKCVRRREKRRSFQLVKNYTELLFVLVRQFCLPTGALLFVQFVFLLFIHPPFWSN